MEHRRRPRPPRQQRSSTMETLLAALLGMMVLGGCLMFIVVLSPALLWIGVVAAGIFLMAGLHYLLWGRFLGGMNPAQVDAEESQAWGEQPEEGEDTEAASEEQLFDSGTERFSE